MRVQITNNLLYPLYLIIFTLYIFVAATSLGFDDEFFNILIYEQYGLRGYQFAQIYDTHPPGSYISNAILFNLFGSWEYVRIFSAILCSVFIVFLSRHLSKKHGKETELIFLILLAFNPAFLIWCTSIRWYSYLMCILLWALILPKPKGQYYWFKFSVAMYFMALYSYMTFILFAPIFYLYYANDRRSTNVKIKYILFFGSIFFILYFPQMKVFFEYSILNTGYPNQILHTIAYFYASQVSNQGIFPFSFSSFLSLIGFLTVVASIFLSNKISFIKERYFISYALMNLFLILSSFASRLRSHLFAIPFYALWISTSINSIKTKKTFYIGLLLICVANVNGIYNILNKNFVTKNSLNINVNLAENFIEKETKSCKGKTIVISYDPKLSWHINNKNIYDIYSPYLNYKNEFIKNDVSCLIVLNTFGGISKEKKLELQTILESAKISRSEAIQIDNSYKYKKLFIKEYPKNIISADVYQNINIDQLNIWIKGICTTNENHDNLYCRL
ncbi:glycosyltransferase family 39 protein [Gammaproteobacteria bacterium]|nr:glycosyltransferase family 39 protein [Gammaproteobacteria bacterium]